MSLPSITFADDESREIAEAWGDLNDVNTVETLAMHLEQKFPVSAVSVADVEDHESFLILRLSAEDWTERKEVALFDNGSLAW